MPQGGERDEFLRSPVSVGSGYWSSVVISVVRLPVTAEGFGSLVVGSGKASSVVPLFFCCVLACAC